MPVKKVVAIHQPNFFPWLGFFNKVACSDVFILMDNVQFPKKGGSWSNRVQLAINGQAAWVTMPVVRSFHGTRIIKDMQIVMSAALVAPDQVGVPIQLHQAFPSKNGEQVPVGKQVGLPPERVCPPLIGGHILRPDLTHAS